MCTGTPRTTTCKSRNPHSSAGAQTSMGQPGETAGSMSHRLKTGPVCAPTSHSTQVSASCALLGPCSLRRQVTAGTEPGLEQSSLPALLLPLLGGAALAPPLRASVSSNSRRGCGLCSP